LLLLFVQWHAEVMVVNWTTILKKGMLAAQQGKEAY
jgi:hypothetical protein